MEKIITSELLGKAYSYQSYKELILNLLSENKATGNSSSENLITHAKLNLENMELKEKTTFIGIELKYELNKLRRPMIFLIIGEAWCGDVAQNLPVIYLISQLNKNIELKILLRDENPEVMSQFLTNGARAIPVCIMLDRLTLNVIGKWGPRPAPAQSIMMEFKKNPEFSRDEVIKRISNWYNEDMSETIQNEFLELLQIINQPIKPGV